MRKKSKIFKNFLATASVLGLSLTLPTNEIYAAGISTIIGDATLNDTNTNWDPEFIENSTIVVGADNVRLHVNASRAIRAIRLDNTLSYMGILDDNGYITTVGSIAGAGKLTKFQFSGDGTNLILTGEAGAENNPVANDYSGLQEIDFAYNSNLTINAPITLNADVVREANHYTYAKVNVNDNVILTADVLNNVDSINIAGDKSLTLSASNSPVYRSTVLTFGANTVLNINGNNSTIVGDIINGANGTLNINAGITTATNPTITTIKKTNIDDNITFNIDSVNSDMDLLNNGAKIIFEGANSQLGLVNSSDANGNDRTFTLYANLNPSNAEDEFGIVRVATGEKNLTITDNGGLFTIGQDATHRLKEFIIDQIGAGNIGNIVINETIFTKLLSMNSTGQVTFNQALDLGANGQLVYNADGEIVANGITGPVTTSAPDQGTLTIASGGVTGAIGDPVNALLVVNITSNGNVNLGSTVNTGSFNINNAAANVTAQGQITGNVLYNQPGTLNLYGDNSIVGKVEFKSANDTLNINIRANETFAANIDNIVEGKNGTVTIIGGGNPPRTPNIINSTIGATNPINNLIFQNTDGYSLNVNLNGKINAQNVQFIRNNNQNNFVRININNNIVGAIQNISNGTNDFTLNIANGVKITGTIDSQNVKVATIKFVGGGEVTGAITNATNVNFNGDGNVILGSTANSTNFVVNNAAANATITGLATGDLGYNTAGSITANNGLKGNIDFNGINGIFNLGNGATITGDIVSSGGVGGTLNFTGDGNVTGSVGDALEYLTEIIFNGVDNIAGTANSGTVAR
ncbi:MAG: beta strand repeat-containing protein [Rickettsia endosymbiont of Pentastiridius leporinus]